MLVPFSPQAAKARQARAAAVRRGNPIICAVSLKAFVDDAVGGGRCPVTPAPQWYPSAPPAHMGHHHQQFDPCDPETFRRGMPADTCFAVLVRSTHAGRGAG